MRLKRKVWIRSGTYTMRRPLSHARHAFDGRVKWVWVPWWLFRIRESLEKDNALDK